MAETAIPALDSRPVVRCIHCGLVQFTTVKGRCRRCRKHYCNPEPPPKSVQTVSSNLGRERWSSLGDALCALVRVLRIAYGWRQEDLAAKIGAPRQYVCKVECHLVFPGGQGNMSRAVSRYAQAFGVTPGGFVLMLETMYRATDSTSELSCSRK